MNRPLTSKKTKAIIKTLKTMKSSGLYGFPAKFYQSFKDELMPTLLKHF